MGANPSKSEAGPSQHVFSAETPVRFSHELIDSMQQSPQTDGARARAQEAKLQARVASELERLSSASQNALRDLVDKVASETPSPEESATVGDKIGDAFSTSKTLEEKQRRQNMSRDLVQKEVEELRQKLSQRKGLKEPDEGVQSAKNELVACLRANDRRPLDCWQEVENFRNQVGRMEKEFVQKTVR